MKLNLGVWVSLIGCTLLLAGCSLDHTAKEVAAMRKAGDLAGARNKAVEHLQDNPERMDVWRELAATDVALCHSHAKAKEDVMQPLMEAALICAAVTSHEKGKPDEKWQAVGNLAAVEVINQASYLSSSLKIQHETFSSHTESLIMPDDLPEDFQNMMKDQFDRSSRLQTFMRGQRVYADPESVRKYVRKGVAFEELLKRLPSEDAHLTAVTAEQLDQKLRVSTDGTDLTPDQVNSIHETALKSVMDALNKAEGDLKDQGYFSAETIFQNGLVE